MQGKLLLPPVDSLTHLVLGAAIGEATLGKKIGNRALIWGAIGETIPDLDVFAGPFLTDLQAMAFHRGITHSIVFAVLAPLLVGYLVYRLYGTGFHATKGYKTFIAILNGLMLVAITVGINYLFREQGFSRWVILMITAAASLFLLWRLHQYYWKKDLERPVISYRQWYWLFFLTFATHILLDCCTAYGTQVFQPFSDKRVAFDNIAVADPAYTFPFLICVVIMAFMTRNTKRRTVMNWIGIGISCSYLLFTVNNKIKVDKVFDKALAHRHIEPTRTRTTATILNNILWACVAEDREHYYIAQYSLLDSDPNLHYLNVLPKHDSIRQMLADEPDYKKLLWFSNGYLAEFPTDSCIFLSDIRYGGFADTVSNHTDMFMNFKVVNDKGEWQFTEYREPFKGTIGEAFKKLWIRVLGY